MLKKKLYFYVFFFHFEQQFQDKVVDTTSQWQYQTKDKTGSINQITNITVRSTTHWNKLYIVYQLFRELNLLS